MEHQGEIILYQPEEAVRLEVRLEDETVWLNRQQMAELFGRDIKTVGKHINNALNEELSDTSTVAKFATVQQNSVVAKFATTAADGKVYQVEYYNLDVILSVGYRVKSNRGIEFRRWANKVLKEYLLKGYAIHGRIEQLENKVEKRLNAHEHQLEKLSNKVDFFVRTSLPPVEGIFFDGQMFDAYTFISNLIKSAKKSIVVIDNYVDESVLLMLSKRQAGVTATIYTQQVTPELKLDLTKHNKQYASINIQTYKQAHDRFVIIDNTDVYHIGASLKDLGKKLFAFSKMNIPATTILKML